MSIAQIQLKDGKDGFPGTTKNQNIYNQNISISSVNAFHAAGECRRQVKMMMMMLKQLLSVDSEFMPEFM